MDTQRTRHRPIAPGAIGPEGTRGSGTPPRLLAVVAESTGTCAHCAAVARGAHRLQYPQRFDRAPSLRPEDLPAGRGHQRGSGSGLPLGLSFLGPAWSEPALIALAQAFEQASQALSWPSLQAT